VVSKLHDVHHVEVAQPPLVLALEVDHEIVGPPLLLWENCRRKKAKMFRKHVKCHPQDPDEGASPEDVA
jgi:hypothetical protein